ncbi:20S proteasome subunit beta 3 [Pancytospora philotis]|nr:20S proteasome subunit beta 3 [Pancytospora philotis]KAI4291110.1 20S proteasome subunit beta 3 [Pancytospora philotis]
MSDIETHYGGSIVAMVGKGCVSIVNDNRLGSGFITTSKTFTRIHEITPRIFVGLPLFIPDCQALLKKIEKQVELYRLDEGADIEPREFASMLSYMLYANRRSPLYTDPIVIGLDSAGDPYICGMDCLGCKSEPGTFVATGTASKNLVGMCDALYREGMSPDELFTASVQAFLNAVDRDALSGWGATCVVLTREGKITRKIKGRCD